ncbi:MULTISPECIES: DUF3048 domain-containing protein [Aeribacillus]|jgi:Protein of unknown function (DUF3048).|uniref:DUF3048 domain-containing protein n=1 Tax=Aeribacillus TaxID=1055323 RepID=UPI0007B4A7A5|nr:MULTISPECIES: DUF3048 domain-containing protein [Aeribacillus]KZM54022.1 lipoprotein YerB [Aeribacillus pallidus]MDR9797542.1 DUF3048 domain-containing protein [Aeribacillus pallidus]MED0651412.1 DUF3048 domain-containing protein [Aeribacillus composti]MED1437666.1 DUF3048 domain-containing protein [Aeribacillus composti]MED4488232.1 DUF3048 domain-containing protein [Aeribacillus pallidus]
MKRTLILFTMLFFVFITACTNEKEKEKTNDEPSSSENQPVEKETAVSPLTGNAATGSIDSRPIAVTINNHPKARPQSGLNKADIVYEALAEGTITRFLAIYQSEKPKIIGPVRSAREYFVDLSKGYEAIYISHGWSPTAKEMLESEHLDYLNGLFYDGTLFWRDSTRKAPHNSYISFENVVKGAKENGYSMTKEVAPLPFLSDEEISGISGEEMLEAVVSYGSKPEWRIKYVFDQQLGRYKRYSGDELTVDRETEEPVLLDNIFIVQTDHRFLDDYGRRTIDLNSGGEGILLQKGMMKRVDWKNVNGRILPYENEEQVKLVPGHTWINIVPDLDKAFQNSAEKGE